MKDWTNRGGKGVGKMKEGGKREIRKGKGGGKKKGRIKNSQDSQLCSLFIGHFIINQKTTAHYSNIHNGHYCTP